VGRTGIAGAEFLDQRRERATVNRAELTKMIYDEAAINTLDTRKQASKTLSGNILGKLS
jgi:hypothetical protein